MPYPFMDVDTSRDAGVRLLACASSEKNDNPVRSQVTEGSPRVEDGQVVDAQSPAACNGSDRIPVACRQADGSEAARRCRDGFYGPCASESCDGPAQGPASVNEACQVTAVAVTEPSGINLSVQLPDGYYEPRRVGDATECGSDPGWYWGGGIFLCPASCERLAGVKDIAVFNGCESIWREP
jgi:hypothetical protein